MQSYKLTVSYFGEEYVGWQVQPDRLSVQEVLETVWAKITQEKLRITASGRTDSGVHALAQVCSVATNCKLKPEILRRAINANTPEDIEVLAIEPVPDGFHAIRHSTEKTYRYQINWGQPRDVFQRGRSWYIPQKLDLEAMAEAAKYLVGEMDFRSFVASKTGAKTTVRNVTQLRVLQRDQKPFQNIWIEATANGFLYNMVRNFVGTLVEVGYGNRPPQWVQEVLRGHDRQLGGMTAPAWGLYLAEVKYDLSKIGAESGSPSARSFD